MAALLGILVAMSFGSGDFLGGRASQHANTTAVLLLGQFVAVAGALVVALSVGARVAGSDIAYGIGAGALNITGLGLLYHGIAHGRISIVAPLNAVVAALVPVGWALLRGERPSAIVLVGAGCAIVAGALVARERDPEADRGPIGSGVVYAVGSGALLGASLVMYSETSDASGFWPVLTARFTGLVLVAGFVAFVSTRAHLQFPVGAARTFALCAGALDVTATALLIAAVRHGLLVVVAPIAALAPAFTVLWARVILRESMARSQLLGIGLALVGLVLVAAG